MKKPIKKGFVPSKCYVDDLFNREMKQYNQAIDDYDAFIESVIEELPSTIYSSMNEGLDGSEKTKGMSMPVAKELARALAKKLKGLK